MDKHTAHKDHTLGLDVQHTVVLSSSTQNSILNNKFHTTSLENLKNTLFCPRVTGLESGLPNEYNVFKSLSKLM